MSDSMAFLTGAALAGVAALFVLKGGDNTGAMQPPTARSLPIPQTNTNPYDTSNPYLTTQPLPTPASPGSDMFGQQRLLNQEQVTAVLEMQKDEIEQLKVQVQNQQLLIDNLTAQADINALPSQIGTAPTVAPTLEQQQSEKDNVILPGLVWGLGGMAVTVSGGIVVISALALLSKQQRPPRTTYVVPHPYTALPPSVAPRRRAEFIPPHLDSRQVEHVEYE
ncbi:MAG: hypothetical protein F6K47_05705 [Symploca sp. SIO2E6]|nr:hypothetical protein [Symploca sp. SIO2E6]